MAKRNILILRSTNHGNKDIKTGYSKTLDLENGSVVALGAISNDRVKDRDHKGAYELDTPTADSTKIAMVYNADVPVLVDEMGNKYKGVISDPRTIHFPPNTVVNVFIPSVGEEIAVTEVAGTATDATHVIVKAGSTKLEYATATTDALIAYEITDRKFVSVGNERVETVELYCVKA